MEALKRKWNIFDAMGEFETIEGIGVVGRQPIIEPGQSYQYISAASIKTDLGMMFGRYTVERLLDGAEIAVKIPKFTLIASYRLN